MCQMISPERVVIWSYLHDPSIAPDAWDGLEGEHFLHGPYRWWFEAARTLRESGGAVDEASVLGHMKENRRASAKTDVRALKRMFKVAPPPRVRANVPLLVKVLTDRHKGLRVDMTRLIN